MKSTLLLVILVLVVQSKFFGQISKPNSILRVHLFPHSHDDVGWVKTADTYYTENGGVRQIISSYMDSLLKDPTKKFSQVEIYFFKRWWLEQSASMQMRVKTLVQNGQLEFLNGGWVMNDEATPYYEDMIDQMTLGHKFLSETFGISPKIGWQIDPFGHSMTQAQLSLEMGFDAWFMGRIDEDEKAIRGQHKELEMMTEVDGDSYLFTHVNFFGYYSSPKGFDLDMKSFSRYNINSQNVPQIARNFVNYFKDQQKQYQGQVIAHTLGMDFQWSDAAYNYAQYDMLINYINDRTEEFEIKIQYSTPSDYLADLKDQDLEYPIRKGDYFPYQDYPNQYWSGYFTSRVAFKGFIKSAGRYTQTIRKFLTLLMLQKDIQIPPEFTKLEEAMGMMQHHDAVTGTAKQDVTVDYVKQLYDALKDLNQYLQTPLQELVKKDTTEQITNFVQCNYNDTCAISESTLSQNQTLLITLINNKVHNDGLTEVIKVQVPKLPLKVLDSQNNVIQGEIICTQQCILYILRTISINAVDYIKITRDEDNPSAKVVEGSMINLRIDSSLQLFDYHQFQLNYGVYVGGMGGAYVFRPIQDQSTQYVTIKTAKKFEGKLVSLIYIEYDKLTTWVEAYAHEKDLYSIDTFVNSLCENSYQSCQLVLLVQTDIKSDKFYTDSNGLKMQERKLNFRPQWDLQVKERVSANYYPVNGMIALQDSKQVVALLNDRAQGGTSLQSGQIELMIHRRVMQDDNKGVMEPLNEFETITKNGQQVNVPLTQLVTHKLVFFNPKTDPNRHRYAQYQMDCHPVIYFSQTEIKEFNLNIKQSLENIAEQYFNKSTKDNLAKVYLQPYNTTHYILRLQNFREDSKITFNLDPNVDYIETTLTGNQPLKDWLQNKINWNGHPPQSPSKQATLASLQIRTFLVPI